RFQGLRRPRDPGVLHGVRHAIGALSPSPRLRRLRSSGRSREQGPRPVAIPQLGPPAADRDLVSSTGSTAPAPPTPVAAAAPGSGGRRNAGPQPYDFRRPNKFNRDHVRALQIVSETFARQMTTVLATTLRAVSTVTLGAVEQLTYDEYVRGVPNPSYLAILA